MRVEKHWTETEKLFVRDNYGYASTYEIAAKIGRTRRGVNAIARKMGIPRWRSTAKTDPLIPIQLGYLAAFLDGEGSVAIIRYHDHSENYPTHFRFRPDLTFYNIWKPAIEEMASWLLACGFHPKVHAVHPKNPKHHIRYGLRLSRPDEVGMLCGALLPYLLIKRRQADLLQEFCRRRLMTQRYDGSEEGYWRKIKDLNALLGRGKP